MTGVGSGVGASVGTGVVTGVGSGVGASVGTGVVTSVGSTEGTIDAATGTSEGVAATVGAGVASSGRHATTASVPAASKADHFVKRKIRDRVLSKAGALLPLLFPG